MVPPRKLAIQVEAQNFAPYVGHLRDVGSQWCNRLLWIEDPMAGFPFGEREKEVKA
jgi:hypothetical protein